MGDSGAGYISTQGGGNDFTIQEDGLTVYEHPVDRAADHFPLNWRPGLLVPVVRLAPDNDLDACMALVRKPEDPYGVIVQAQTDTIHSETSIGYCVQEQQEGLL